MSCSATKASTGGRSWPPCERPALFLDGKCYLHTEHLTGSIRKRIEFMREVFAAVCPEKKK